MKVIGVGFGRTGTASMKGALEILGLGPCYHMIEVIEHPDRVPLWLAAAEGGPVDWDRIFDGYQATVDWPACAFWRQLVEAYPDAKVLLTVRDPQRWYDSAAATIFPVNDPDNPIAQQLARAYPEINAHRDFVQKLVWEREFQGRFADRAHAIEVFERHNAAVRREVAPDRLLEYQVGQGWQPLCDFLGVPVPDVDFPHLNDTAEFQQRIADRLAEL